MKRCYLVRHAQTLWNGENRIQGHTNSPLSPLGFEQARQLAGWFARRRIDGIFSSWLLRSRETALAIATDNGHRVAPVIERDLAEINLGAWEGLTPLDVESRYPGAYEIWRTRPSRVAIPDAEPLTAFQERVRGVFGRLAAGMREGGEYVVVTHGGVIAAFLAEVLEADFDTVLRRMRLDNAGITAVDFNAAPPALLYVNDTGHLASDPAVLPLC